VSDVAVVGGGIVGCSLAALLAEGGAAVTLYEREAIAAAASGRNSGVLQYPLDELMVPVHERSLELYRTLGHGFSLPEDPPGVLVVSEDGEALRANHDDIAARFPELAVEWLEGAALEEAEPGLGDGLHAFRQATGRTVPPAAACQAWARRAREAGAELRVGEAVEDVRALAADTVVVAAGPWTPELAGVELPIAPLWGVNVEVRLSPAPRHALEELGVEDIAEGPGADSIFSIVTADGASAVGSTFLADEPDVAAWAPRLLERGARFWPALEGAAYAARACPRPQSADGRPLLGPVDDGLYVASGHGPWGISLGPGSAELVAGAILRGAQIPPELAASRFSG
jgi:glycine/D-amino acid oxidase-like deaminating enzyme